MVLIKEFRYKVNDHGPPRVTELSNYLFVLVIAGILLGLAFSFNTPKEIWNGSLKILFSPANLVTDYFALANIGSALVNASLMILKSLLIIRFTRVEFTGPLLAAIFTIAGFSLFGKNIFNSIPIILGVILYAKMTHTQFKNYLVAALFGTALGPLVSEISFNVGLSTPMGIFLGYLAGILTGVIIPPLSRHFVNFHKGFSLYNIGFTTGIIGMAFIAILRAFGIEVSVVNWISRGDNPIFTVFLLALFSFIFLCGLIFNDMSMKGYRQLLNEDGRGGSDFLSKYGFGITLINMALLGLLTTGFTLLVGGEFNGPVLGGIFTVVGFGAFGKHVKNVLPILVGVCLVCLFTPMELSSTNFLLTALFGTTLAPISGYYGVFAGILAGGLHMTMASNITYLHAGMNLYNNGFSGGFIAAIIIPLLEGFHSHKNKGAEIHSAKQPTMNGK